MGVSDKTLSLYKFELERFIDWLNENGVIHLEDMTAMIIREYIVAMQEQGRNEGGRHCAYRVIRTMSYFWEQETEGEYIAAIRKVKIKSPPDEPIEPISRSDINRLLAECDNDWGGVRDTAIIRVLLDTGVRGQELCNLNLSDLDVDGGALTVHKGKGGKSRTVFFGKTTRRALRRWLRERGSDSWPLFTTDEEGRLKFAGLRQIIRRRAESAGLAEPGLHTFQRAFTLALIQAGVDVLTISRLLGHSNVTLVQRYAKQKALDLQERYKSPADG